MASRPLNRTRLRERIRTDDGVIDLRDHGGPLVKKSPRQNRTGPRRIEPVDLERPAQLRDTKYFGSPAFRRLWFSQCLSSLGDWIGLVALTAIAYRVGGALAMGAPALVIAARIVPGLFASPVAGVLLDRWNRKHIMVVSDIGRACVLFVLPFYDNLVGLIIASLVLELFTLMWSPAKEASVPNLVRKDFLPTANSLSLIASYGTIVPATALFAVLSKVPEWMGQSETLSRLDLTKESVALYFDGMTYLLSALVIATLAIPFNKKEKKVRPADVSRTKSGLRDAWEGLKYVGATPRVRAVTFGMATGLIGGGMAVTLGPGFADKVLGAGSGGYGLLMTTMGVGVALGVLIVSMVQKRLPIERCFVLAIFGASIALAAAATMNGLAAAAILIAVMGAFAGALYVLGFTILQLSVDDDLRGRVFATFYTVTRLSILIGLAFGPLLSLGFGELSDALFDGDILIAGVDLELQGVRLTLWLGAAIIACAGVVASRAFRRVTVPQP